LRQSSEEKVMYLVGNQKMDTSEEDFDTGTDKGVMGLSWVGKN
jgi:hypothetical protein